MSYIEDLLRLQTTGILPSSVGGGASALSELNEFIDARGSGGVGEWLLIGADQLTSLNEITNAMVGDATIKAGIRADDARNEARSFLILAGSVVLLALVMAVVIGRSISRPLTRLTRSAEQLSSEELPALVESMRSSGRTEAPVLTPIEAKGRDEVAQLARAISEIQQVTVDVAEEQGEMLRRGISDIFVNLARRNQSLLDRQIDFIDQLESREENPDQLENLFRLDHLATRMRRNAESLLVLAGAEPTRRRGRPVAIVDVLRVAMGEIEDFSRVKLVSVDSSTVAGSVAVDLAHLMSELMENATQFSPPDVNVEVVGHRVADDSYQLTLSDRGIGMSEQQIQTANKTLAEPPLVGLDLSRSLGFTVVSRLAHRLGVGVRLTSGAEGGVTAVIAVPAEMIGDEEETRAVEPPSAESATVASPGPDAAIPVASTPAPAPEPMHNEPAVADSAPEPAVADSEPVPAKSGTGMADPGKPTTLPRRPVAPAAATDPEPPTIPAVEPSDGDLFAAFGTPAATPASPADSNADLFAPLDATPAPPTRKPVAPTESAPSPTALAAPATPPIQADVRAPEAPLEPPTRDPAAVGAVSAQVTSAGLIRRTPKKVSVADTTRPSANATEAAGATANRSPEEVRQMLSRYRAGLRKGRAPEPDTDQSNRRS